MELNLNLKYATEKAWNKKTNKELKEFIREATKEVNRRGMPKDKVAKDMFTRLQHISGQKEVGEYLLQNTTYKIKVDGKSKSKAKVKSELIYQARELKKYLQTDFNDPITIKALNKRHKQALNSYNKEHPDNKLSEEEYDDIMEVLGALHDKVKGHETSDAVIEIMTKRKEDIKEVNMVSVVKNMLDNNPGLIDDKDLIVRKLYEELGLVNTNKE